MNKAPISAWVGNLGKYNEGELVGTWIDFPINEDDLQKILRDKVLIGTTDEFGQPYEEYGIFDWESDYVDYPGEWENLDTINEWAEYIDSLKEYELDILEAANEAGYVDNVLDFDPNNYCLYYDVNTPKDLGYYEIDNIWGGIEYVNAGIIEDYFDYEALGRDIDFDLWGDDEVSAAEYWCGREEASDYDIGKAYIDECGIEGVKNPKNYFDYEAYGESIAAYEGEFTSKGFIYEA